VPRSGAVGEGGVPGDAPARRHTEGQPNARHLRADSVSKTEYESIVNEMQDAHLLHETMFDAGASYDEMI
jgi:hypothetical protein